MPVVKEILPGLIRREPHDDHLVRTARENFPQVMHAVAGVADRGSRGIEIQFAPVILSIRHARKC